MSISGKVALVTGAGQGIGRGIALRLARDGADIAVMDVNAKALAVVAKEIEAQGRRAATFTGDVSDRSQVYAAIEYVEKQLGGFDIMVNNAGIAQVQAIAHVTPEEVEHIFKINFQGVLWGTQAAAKKFKARAQKGKIINACSIAGHDGFASAHHGDLNVVMCHRSINYVADMLEKKYGIPWFKVNFIGAEASAKSLRKIAAYFEDKELMDRVEAVIAEEMAKIAPIRDQIKARSEGKTAMMFVGGSRAHHYQNLFKEIGMKILAAGYEFAHRDDYEGRDVLPTIKVDADSRNIEELVVKPDPAEYRPRKSAEELARLAASGFTFKDYEGMMPGWTKVRWLLTLSFITRPNNCWKNTNPTFSAQALKKNM